MAIMLQMEQMETKEQMEIKVQMETAELLEVAELAVQMEETQVDLMVQEIKFQTIPTTIHQILH